MISIEVASTLHGFVVILCLVPARKTDHGSSSDPVDRTRSVGALERFEEEVGCGARVSGKADFRR